MAKPDPNETSSSHPQGGINAELVAVLVAVSQGSPRALTIESGRALPSGPFQVADRSLQASLRSWVERQTHHPLGYVEQLYTFADRDRHGGDLHSERHVVSISYLGLTRESDATNEYGAFWHDWYSYFPWEDHRTGPPPMLAETLLPRVQAWADANPARAQTAAVAFGLRGQRWNEELILQRYELLFEAGLVQEACSADPVPGAAMLQDHRRILATAIARLRAKIKYRPVVFELMPPAFTLLQLQQGVEAIAGRAVHKQNFRRLIEQQELVEETGAISAATGGRPAKLFRFRRDVVDERAALGTKPSVARS